MGTDPRGLARCSHPSCALLERAPLLSAHSRTGGLKNCPLLFREAVNSVFGDFFQNGINLLTGVPTAMGAGAPYNRRGIIQGGGLIAGLHIESQPGYPRRAVSALHGFANAPKGTRISGNASTGFQFHAPSN